MGHLVPNNCKHYAILDDALGWVQCFIYFKCIVTQSFQRHKNDLL